jgi:hypothetical protein
MTTFLWFVAIACILVGLLFIIIQLWEKLDFQRRQTERQYSLGDLNNPDPFPLNSHEMRWRQEMIARQKERDG